MNFEQFETEFLIDLKKKKKSCISKLDKNRELLEANLGNEGNQKTINKFVNEIINLIFQTSKFNLYEKALKHPTLVNVYTSFQNSEVLIEACKEKKKDILKWLITMSINPCIQDRNGATALMYASKEPSLLFVVKYLASKEECLNLLDKNNQNAIFYALPNKVILEELINTNINMNQRNINNDTALLYCCKMGIYEPISTMVLSKNLDVNVVDNDGKTPAMYLTEQGRAAEIMSLNRRNCNFDFINSKKESVLTILIRKLYLTKDGYFANYIHVLIVLLYCGCNFNAPVDAVGNTAFMVMMIVNDSYTIYYICKNCKSIDLSVKNHYGENATSLLMKYKNFNSSIIDVFKNHPTFDVNYFDNKNNNNLFHLCAMVQPDLIKQIIENDVNIINSVNSKDENALILATKSRCREAVQQLYKYGIYVNQQDYLGNTALHYAIKLKDIYIIKSLIVNHADINIQNIEGISPLNIAHELGDKEILNVLTFPHLDSPQYFDPNSIKENINKTIKPEELFPETAEYLYPCIHNYYPKFEMTYPMECLEKSIYTGKIKNIEMYYACENYSPPVCYPPNNMEMFTSILF